MDQERRHRTDDNQSERKSTLELSEDVWQEFSSQAYAFVTEYLRNVTINPIFPPNANLGTKELVDLKLSEDGATVEEILTECRALTNASRHTGNPRFFGYVASTASAVGMLGDYMASAINQNLTAWRSSPGATDLERTVVRWLGSFIGYSEKCGGLLTSGGSMANLNALYIAHRAKNPDASQKGLFAGGKPMTVYASDQVHLSIVKALDILGIGREQLKLVTTDERFRLDVRVLREHLKADIAKGLKPFCVVASAGTVNTGAVDPLDEIANVAEQFDLWFHVDGAYGVPAAAHPASHSLFTGLELADSVSLDPHKWLYAPIDCGCLLMRSEARARAAFSQGDESYIKIFEESEREAFAFWDYGVELTRRFRALKVWMILRYYGSRRIAETIAEDIELAKYLAAQIEAANDFELLAPVELSICCFRYVPEQWRMRLESAVAQAERKVNESLNTLNERLMRSVQRGGRAYLSNATIRDRFALRACIVNFRTTRTDIDHTLDVLRETGNEIATSLDV